MLLSEPLFLAECFGLPFKPVHNFLNDHVFCICFRIKVEMDEMLSSAFDGCDSNLYDWNVSEDVSSKIVVIFNIISRSDLRQCIEIDSHPKNIEFRSHAKFPDFQGTIEVEFPPLSVLRTEKVFFEIVPDTVVRKHNLELTKKAERGDVNNGITFDDTLTAGEKLEGIPHCKGVGVDEQKTNRRIVTPILHIDRQNGSPFLRPVKVTLPLMDDEKLQTDIKKSNLEMGDRVTMVDGNDIQFQQTKFSPVAGVYDPVRSLLNAFCFTGDSSLEFEIQGVYFIAKQKTAETVEIDLRRFRSWQEHRTYRMDETAVYFLATNPEAVESRDHGSEVEVSISEQIPGNHFLNRCLEVYKTAIYIYKCGRSIHSLIVIAPSVKRVLGFSAKFFMSFLFCFSYICQQCLTVFLLL